MKYRVTQIRDLKSVLKDMEAFIKDPRYLRIGRDLSNFSLRPREILANWLMCVVGNHISREDGLTFTEDPTGGDGVIRNRQSGECFLTEHVFVGVPQTVTGNSVEYMIVNAVEHKKKKGTAYAKGKHLVVFSEAKGSWLPNRVGKIIDQQHSFESVWAVGLENVSGSVYNYWVVLFGASHSPSWRVSVDFDRCEWTIGQIQ